MSSAAWFLHFRSTFMVVPWEALSSIYIHMPGTHLWHQGSQELFLLVLLSLNRKTWQEKTRHLKQKLPSWNFCSGSLRAALLDKVLNHILSFPWSICGSSTHTPDEQHSMEKTHPTLSVALIQPAGKNLISPKLRTTLWMGVVTSVFK